MKKLPPKLLFAFFVRQMAKVSTLKKMHLTNSHEPACTTFPLSSPAVSLGLSRFVFLAFSALLLFFYFLLVTLFCSSSYILQQIVIVINYCSYRSFIQNLNRFVQSYHSFSSPHCCSLLSFTVRHVCCSPSSVWSFAGSYQLLLSFWFIFHSLYLIKIAFSVIVCYVYSNTHIHIHSSALCSSPTELSCSVSALFSYASFLTPLTHQLILFFLSLCFLFTRPIRQ